MAHTHEGVEHHRTVGREVDHLVAERVVGGCCAGSSEKEHKVALQNGGSTKVGVERN